MYIITSLIYFFFMQKKKPGPPKGQKLNEVKRTPIGERLFRSRKARGLTQTEFGLRVGLSRRMVAHYESDETIPSVEVLTKMAEILNVTVSYLLGESTLKKLDSDMKPLYRKHIEILQRLPINEQKTIIEMTETLELKQNLKKKNNEQK
jgi:transcriptional regulator with XRE-family HTH domain